MTPNTEWFPQNIRKGIYSVASAVTGLLVVLGVLDPAAVDRYTAIAAGAAAFIVQLMAAVHTGAHDCECDCECCREARGES